MGEGAEAEPGRKVPIMTAFPLNRSRPFSVAARISGFYFAEKNYRAVTPGAWGIDHSEYGVRKRLQLERRRKQDIAGGVIPPRNGNAWKASAPVIPSLS